MKVLIVKVIGGIYPIPDLQWDVKEKLGVDESCQTCGKRKVAILKESTPSHFNGCSPTACGCKSLADCPNNQSFITVQFKSQPLPIKGVEREWISVEERLPQESGRYWCYVLHFGELGRSSEQVNCSYSERHGFTEKLNPMNVTHWMPLPKRPQI